MEENDNRIRYADVSGGNGSSGDEMHERKIRSEADYTSKMESSFFLCAADEESVTAIIMAKLSKRHIYFPEEDIHNIFSRYGSEVSSSFSRAQHNRGGLLHP